MPASARLRPATPADLEAVFAVERRAALAAFAHVFPPGRYPYPDDEVRARLDAALTTAEVEVLVAEHAGEVIGYVSLGTGLVRNLYVAPEAWGQGIGSTLLGAAVERLRRAGVERPRLWVLEQNGRARALYERHGWRADGESRRTGFPPHPRLVRYALEAAPAAS